MNYPFVRLTDVYISPTRRLGSVEKQGESLWATMSSMMMICMGASLPSHCATPPRVGGGRGSIHPWRHSSATSDMAFVELLIEVVRKCHISYKFEMKGSRDKKKKSTEIF